MEQRYKDALRQIYRDKLISNQTPDSYADELFKTAKSYFITKKKTNVAASEAATSNDQEVEKSVTEKTLILDSFHQFGQEKLDENDNKPVKVEGGEIAAKNVDSSGLTNEFKLETCSKDLFEKYLLEQTTQELTSLRYTNNKLSNDKIRVLFVSDSFNTNTYEDLTEDIKEFTSLFEPSTAQLFSRMVKAMKLDTPDYILTAVKFNEVDCLDMVLNEINTYQPDLVISLGVTASHGILGITKRLKEIHGKFYKIQLNEFQTEVMPLFSPNLLNTAVNMKKIAWEDMQKAMGHLSL